MKIVQLAKPVPLKQVKLEDVFWSDYSELIRNVVIPYQYEALHDLVPHVEPSRAIRNFRIAAGLEEGEFYGFVFQDSDVAKWLEAVAYSLSLHPDAELEQKADEIIELIGAAQQPDGYLNTYFTIKAPEERWTNLTDCHELYCAGHMIEAAVAYYQATGKRSLLDIVCRFADHIDEVFGPEPDKLQGYDGHQEIELALIRLYEVTGESRYLQLSQFFINERGKVPHFFIEEWEMRGRTSHWTGGAPARKPDLAYHQSHLPVRDQEVAVGHAVRAVYMYTAMADLAAHTGDAALWNACRKLWNNIVHKQMYITGGIGSTHHGEAFTFDYDLPNDTIYAETCASIGLIFFANRMLRLEAKSEYADVMERALYNTVIAGMARDGKHFFYVNPLEVWPEASRRNPGKHHVKPVRPGWYSCACCPPNVARLIASLGEYIYTANDDTLFTHLYIGGRISHELGGKQVTVHQQSSLPWEGNVQFTIHTQDEAMFTLALRLPSWSDTTTIKVNGEIFNLENPSAISNGYALIRRAWQDGDKVEIAFDITARFVRSHPEVRANAGKTALQRGPLVYAFESVDNGPIVSALSIDTHAELIEQLDSELLGGAITIEGQAYREDEKAWGAALYGTYHTQHIPVRYKAIPYYMWGNRGETEMAVWMRAYR